MLPNIPGLKQIASLLSKLGLGLQQTAGPRRGRPCRAAPQCWPALEVLKDRCTPSSPAVVSTGSLSLSGPDGVAVDSQGDLFTADSAHNRVVEVPANGSASVVNTGSLSLASPEN